MHERILLVEDDRDIVDYLGSLLLEEGFVVESVSGQKEAVSLIEEKEYDCLLIDISLSDGNGYAVCSAARQKSGSSKNTSAAVIFLTASGDEYSKSQVLIWAQTIIFKSRFAQESLFQG
jgi:DNA-binding response OmpR family regulator